MAHPANTVHRLEDILAWLQSQQVGALTVDSREVARLSHGARTAFIAWPGAANDGRAFVDGAFQAGACAALVEAEGLSAWLPALQQLDKPWLAVQGLRVLLAEIAHRFYGEPSQALDVIAVTGTNGKTSTSWWTAQALSACGAAAGVIGTLGVGRPAQSAQDSGSCLSTGLTTPDPVTLHRTFRAFVDQGLRAAAIEASSIGIEEHRLDAARIRVAQFTNFTQDHLDYHGSMQAYWQAKEKLFQWPGLEAAVINLDDARGDELAAVCQQRGLDVWTYALHREARLVARRHEVLAQGMTVQVVENAPGASGVDQVELTLPIIGEFNVSNVLCVLGALRARGISLQDAARACAHLTAVPGRMQPVVLAPDAVPTHGEPLVVVDYAHTPDALHKALLALRPVARSRGGRLWCVFGCGGDRDATKRPLMGAMADQYADDVVLTTDNPRRESPRVILSQILMGMVRSAPVAVIEPRDDAIAHAVMQAQPADVILVAGKGHETTQEVAGVKTPFSDVDVSMQALMKRRAA